MGLGLQEMERREIGGIAVSWGTEHGDERGEGLLTWEQAPSGK